MENEKKEALYFFEEGEQPSAIYFLGDGNKNEITITSDDREYVRGDQLCVTFNGTDIYCSLDHIIYINTKTKVIQIKENKKLSPPEQREYMILLSFYDGTNSFQGIVGRQEAFDYIKMLAEEIDLDKSMILAETVAFKDGISVYQFMHNCIVDEMVTNDDGFDIEEYYLHAE